MKHLKKFESYSVNESLTTIFLGIAAAFAFLRLIHKLMVRTGRRLYLNKLQSAMWVLSKGRLVNKKGEIKDALQVIEYADRYYVTTEKNIEGTLPDRSGIFRISLPDIRIMKNENLMIVDDIKIELSDKEHSQLLEIITSDD